MSTDPRIIREGGYQGTRDPGSPPASAYQQQVAAPRPPAAPPAGDPGK
jgi:hypothetical protein